MFTYHKHNLKQLVAILAVHETVWFHGDGNMFITEESTNFRRDYSNPDMEGAKYRVKFTKGDHIPTTEEEMNALLQSSHRREKAMEKAKQSQSNNPVVVVKVDVDEPAKSGPTLEEMKAKNLEDLRLGLEQKNQELDDQDKIRREQFEREKNQAAGEISKKAQEVETRALELESQAQSVQARLDALANKEKEIAQKEAALKTKTAGAK